MSDLEERAGQLGKWFAEYAEHHAAKDEPGRADKAERNRERMVFAYTLQDDLASRFALDNFTITRLTAQVAALEAREAGLREALEMAHNSVGDIARGFAPSVDPARWVEQLQAVTRAALRAGGDHGQG